MKNKKKPKMGKHASSIASICRSELWKLRDMINAPIDISEIPRGDNPQMLMNPLSRHAWVVDKPVAPT
jgi:hypothetical protein